MPAIVHQFFKYNFIVAAGIFFTFLLFYFMQYLIAIDDDIAPRQFVIKLVDATVPEFELELIPVFEKPELIEVIEAPPIENPKIIPNPGSGGIATPKLGPPPGPSIPPTAIPLSNNILIPLIRTIAAYPSRALQNGIEGFVEITFTVNALGNVVDPVVTYAEPEGYFERVALQSIRRWKYSAAMEEGGPVPTYDVRQRIVFQIEPNSR